MFMISLQQLMLSDAKIGRGNLLSYRKGPLEEQFHCWVLFHDTSKSYIEGPYAATDF